MAKTKYEPLRKRPDGGFYPHSTDTCPSHVATPGNAKICGLCGLHIDELRPSDPEDF